MSNKAAIELGARVWAGSKFLGNVERVIPREDAPDTSYPDLLVHGAADDTFYRIPGAQVRSRRRSHGHTVVRVDLGARPLSSFQSAKPAVTTPTQSPARRLRRGTKASQQRSNRTAKAVNTGEDTQVWRIPVWSEALVAEKRPVTVDTIHIHKRVEDVEQRLDVPLEREELVVEHLRSEDYDGHAADGPDEWIIPVHEERLVVQKQTVISEYVRITRRRRTDAREVHDAVRREVVDLESDVAGRLAESQVRDGTIPPAAPDMAGTATP